MSPLCEPLATDWPFTLIMVPESAAVGVAFIPLTLLGTLAV